MGNTFPDDSRVLDDAVVKLLITLIWGRQINLILSFIVAVVYHDL